MRIAGMIGWGPADLERGSLAMLYAALEGKGRAEGWISPKPKAMTRERLHELMERYPDG